MLGVLQTSGQNETLHKMQSINVLQTLSGDQLQFNKWRERWLAKMLPMS